MGGTKIDRHRPWLAFALEEALRRSLFAPKDLVTHAGPDVLVLQLPHQVISELLSRALASGTFSASSVIDTAPPALLAEYLDPELLWRCLRDIADRGGLSKKGATRAAPARQWLGNVLARALEADLLSPADVLRFLPPTEFVADAPRPVVAELIKSGLTRGTFDAALVLQHLTPTIIADTLETSLVWECIAEAAARAFELDGASAKTPPPVLDKPAATPAPVATGGKSRPSAAPAAVRPDAPPLPKPKAQGGAEPLLNTASAEWRPADDLDVLEEETVANAPIVR